MSHMNSYECGDMDYSAEAPRRIVPIKGGKEKRPVHARRRGKAPLSVNGIHRRRTRKLAW